jgi:2-hydroxy-3-keto-5-methylthiopentenyl-1-phosphate phosphatase
MIVQCDFDGTIITNNMSVMLREAFALDTWRSIEVEYTSRRISVEESNRRQFLLIKQSHATLENFIRDHIEVRPGFVDFIRYCRQKGIRFVIVSAGMDFYIKLILEAVNLTELETYCASTTFESEGIVVKYFDPFGQPIQSDFKLYYLNWLKSQGKLLTYVGDGLSDFDAAIEADYVFASGDLCSLLSKISIKYQGFESFKDIKLPIPIIHI